MKANKINLTEGSVAGGLHDLEQVYRINYLEKEEHYTDKIELVLVLKKKDETMGAYRSLRFSSEAQLKDFIIKLSKAYLFINFKRTNPELITSDLKLIYLNNLLDGLNKEILDDFSKGNL